MCEAQSIQNPAYIAYSLNLGFVLRSGTFGWRHSMCGTHFHITCKFPQNSPRNRSRAKVPDPIQNLKVTFSQGFFKILVPGRHSLGRGIRTPPGILSFSPSLYLLSISFLKLLLQSWPHPAYTGLVESIHKTCRCFKGCNTHQRCGHFQHWK